MLHLPLRCCSFSSPFLLPCLLSLFLLSSLTTALPSPSLLPRDNSTNSTVPSYCPPTTWYIGNFHAYQPRNPPVVPYQAFYFRIYDSTGGLAEASCSCLGAPGTQIDDLLYSYSPSIWHPCHKPNRPRWDVKTGTGGWSDYEFQWDQSVNTVFVRGRGKCGDREVRSQRLEPLKAGVPWVWSWLETGDLGDEAVNPVGSYRIFGVGGEVRLRSDGVGNPVKSFD